MIRHSFSALAAITALLSAALLSVSISTAGRMPGLRLPAQPVRVNVNFNIQVPLDSLDEAAIVAAQTQGRALIYRLVKDECRILLDEIAAACRLTSLNASTNIPQSNSGNPLYVSVSGSGQYAIALTAQ